MESTNNNLGNLDDYKKQEIVEINNENKIDNSEVNSKLNVEGEEIKDFNYGFVSAKFLNYNEILGGKNEDSPLESYPPEKIDVTVKDLCDLYKMTDEMCEYFGFDDLFLHNMGLYRRHLRIHEKSPDYEIPAVDENNKEINNLRNRIGLIFYLYDNNLSENIDEYDVNRISELFNEILDIREFFNIYYFFRAYIWYTIFPDEKGIKRFPDEKIDIELRNKRKAKAQEALKSTIEWEYLGRGLVLKYRAVLEDEFLKDYRGFYMTLNSDLSSKIEQLYSILEKGNNYKNLIKNNTKEIEESFRKHLFIKESFVEHLFNYAHADGGINWDCRLLGADKSPVEVEASKKDFSYEKGLKDKFTKHVLLKNFNGDFKTEDLKILIRGYYGLD